MALFNRVATTWPPDPDWFNDRSGKWLRRAEEVRRIAETMRSLEMRLVLERIATGYEQLAELVAKNKNLALVRKRHHGQLPAARRRDT